MEAKQPCVYILASGRHGSLYIGVTSNLLARIYQHREGLIEGFTKRYDIKRLVWFEMASDMETAIRREKQLKKWNRDWKARLIEQSNPDWVDLAIGLGFEPLASQSRAGRDAKAPTGRTSGFPPARE
ncbi:MULTISPECIES: GIY-YIG nuclease family protein [unclassified Sphingomonas]|uniref:GIY-YIG nuclease family protein n=1 Tax=unclassified Sphingomonas TaxID=196159 RepID=UPI000E1074AF|nr:MULTISPECIES: GIY-YIG nuclease family protein [unclassified Sphingomonas]AXJ95375.1 GIY-YIG nuclease family protein [Sphingomonas sp. FARSPH]